MRIVPILVLVAACAGEPPAPPATHAVRIELGGDSAELDPAKLLTALDEQILVPANRIADDVYGIPAPLLCSDGEHVDPVCAMGVTLADLRVQVTEVGDARELSLQADADHDELVSGELTPTSLVANARLESTSRAIAALAPQLGDLVPAEQLTGEVSLGLDVVGESAVVAVSVPRPITVAIAGEPALAIDVNPDDGRSLTATISGDAVTVSPKLDLRIAQDVAAVDLTALPSGSAAAYDLRRLVLVGGLRGVGSGGAVRVADGGELALVTAPAGAGVDAHGGQCVDGSDAGFHLVSCASLR